MVGRKDGSSPKGDMKTNTLCGREKLPALEGPAILFEAHFRDTLLLFCRSVLILSLKAGLCFVMLFPGTATAQLQLAWVARYTNGMVNGTNQPIGMALDNASNICVAGYSENTNGNLGYVTIKYAPNGVQLWATRLDLTNSTQAIPAALAVDGSNNVLVTGNAGTVKYDPNGNQLWLAPYPGSAVATDSNGAVFVTGSPAASNIVKLSSSGSNLWVASPYPEPTSWQSVLLDGKGNPYVSGDVVGFTGLPSSNDLQSLQLNSSNGIPESTYVSVPSEIINPEDNPPQIAGAAMDGAGNFYVGAAFGSGSQFIAEKWNIPGGERGFWFESFPLTVTTKGTGLVLDSAANVLVTGQTQDASSNLCYGTIKISATGVPAWTNYYSQSEGGESAATSLAVDAANNCYVTGYSSDSNGINDMVTVKYSTSGRQAWSQRYVNSAGGDSTGEAVAADHQGNLYVTGYETLSGGGTGMVTIKYAPFTIAPQPDGAVLVQAEGSPGESFDFWASSDLRTWLNLGSAVADTNGAAQFLDTGASNFSARFYYTNPQ
jgi:hypothetical protein